MHASCCAAPRALLSRIYLHASTPRGFEPLRAEPNGFRVHHLSHSVTVSLEYIPLYTEQITVLSSLTIATYIPICCFPWDEHDTTKARARRTSIRNNPPPGPMVNVRPPSAVYSLHTPVGKHMSSPIGGPQFEPMGGDTSTPRGFEPLRAEPNGFLVHHLSHSVTVSLNYICLYNNPNTVCVYIVLVVIHTTTHWWLKPCAFI